MRGYFAIGVEGISKAGNLGALMRTAHAFGASFVFTVAAWIDRREMRHVDTSDTGSHLPAYDFASVEHLVLPQDCRLIGVELLDDAVVLPSFRHPVRAAYVLGPERASLTPDMVARCDHVVRIPTRFCLNLGVAGAIVMYDRMISLGRFAERPVRVGAPAEPLATPVFGPPAFKTPLPPAFRRS